MRKKNCAPFIFSSEDKLSKHHRWEQALQKGDKLTDKKIKRINRLSQNVVHGIGKQIRNSNSRHGLQGLCSQFVDVFH